MNRSIVCLLLAMIFFSVRSHAQKITYSELIRQDNRDITFEILGKVGDHYVIYKNLRNWKHMIQVLNTDMETLSNNGLDYISDRTFNVDFVTYADQFYMIYQYEKNNVIYSKAVKLDSDGKKLMGPVTLDTTKVNIFNDTHIYGTSYSEDRQKILVYKLQKQRDDLHIVMKRYDRNLQLIDSIRSIVPYNERKDVYSDMQIANDGTIVYARQMKSAYRENINNLEIHTIMPGNAGEVITPLSLQDKFIDEVSIKVDNLNKNFLINTFYYTRRFGNIDGLFSALLSGNGALKRSNFNLFSDSIRTRFSNNGQIRFAFDDLFMREIFVKRDGSYLLVSEDFSSQTRTNPWNRWDYLYGSPYISPSYANRYGYYRPFSSYSSTTRYYYENILVVGIDSSLKQEWSNIIYKNQSDEETDNFLSYNTLNSGSQIHFLFIERENNAQVISDQAITAYGEMERFPTLKSRETGYQFMPKLAKQVGIRQVIVPCLYRGSIAFAKIDFSAN